MSSPWDHQVDPSDSQRREGKNQGGKERPVSKKPNKSSQSKRREPKNQGGKQKPGSKKPNKSSQSNQSNESKWQKVFCWCKLINWAISLAISVSVVVTVVVVVAVVVIKEDSSPERNETVTLQNRTDTTFVPTPAPAPATPVPIDAPATPVPTDAPTTPAPAPATQAPTTPFSCDSVLNSMDGNKAMPNRMCQDAALIPSDGSIVCGTARNANNTRTDFQSCQDTQTNSIDAHLWYKVQGTGQRIRISTCSEHINIDTAIAVYADNDCFNDECLRSTNYFYSTASTDGTADGGPLASSYGEADCSLTSAGASSVVFDSEPNKEYKFYVSDKEGRLDGTFGLTVTSYTPPANDQCNNAELITPNGPEIVGSTVNATVSTDYDTCWWIGRYSRQVHIRGGTVWYRLFGTGERITISTCSLKTNFDTAIGIYANHNCFDDTCLNDSSGNDNDSTCTLTGSGASTVSFDSVVGMEYKFYVSDKEGRLDGGFGLTVKASSGIGV